MKHDSKLDVKLLRDLQSYAFSAAEQDIRHGADVNASFDKGYGIYSSLLSEMAYEGNVKGVEFLIRHHVKLDRKDALGETILQSLSDVVKMDPESPRSKQYRQILDLLNQASSLAIEPRMNGVIDNSKPSPIEPRMNGVIDDPEFGLNSGNRNSVVLPSSQRDVTAKEQLVTQINVAAGTNFGLDDQGNILMKLTSEQTANINKFAFEHPKEADALFPKSVGLDLSLENHQLVITNYDELEKVNRTEVSKDVMLKSFDARRQAILQLLNGDLEEAARSINKVELHEKLSSIVQFHGAENLRPQQSQIDGGQHHQGDFASQSVGSAGKSPNIGIA